MCVSSPYGLLLLAALHHRRVVPTPGTGARWSGAKCSGYALNFSRLERRELDDCALAIIRAGHVAND
jgi:hypothetical protein